MSNSNEDHGFGPKDYLGFNAAKYISEMVSSQKFLDDIRTATAGPAIESIRQMTAGGTASNIQQMTTGLVSEEIRRMASGGISANIGSATEGVFAGTLRRMPGEEIANAAATAMQGVLGKTVRSFSDCLPPGYSPEEWLSPLADATQTRRSSLLSLADLGAVSPGLLSTVSRTDPELAEQLRSRMPQSKGIIDAYSAIAGKTSAAIGAMPAETLRNFYEPSGLESFVSGNAASISRIASLSEQALRATSYQQWRRLDESFADEVEQLGDDPKFVALVKGYGSAAMSFTRKVADAGQLSINTVLEDDDNRNLAVAIFVVIMMMVAHRVHPETVESIDRFEAVLSALLSRWLRPKPESRDEP